MAKERFVHEYDTLMCDHYGNNRAGAKPNFTVPDSRQLRAETYRVVTDVDLDDVILGHCSLKKNPCVKVKRNSIQHGLAENVKLDGHRPLLTSLIVVTLDAKGKDNGFAHIVTTFEERLIANEGWELKAQSTDGHPTVGVGFNMDRLGAKDDFNAALGQKDDKLFNDVKDGKADLTDDQVKDLFKSDLAKYTANADKDLARTLPDYDKLGDDQKTALREMFYTGNPLSNGWKKMTAALKNKNFDEAARQLLQDGKGGTSIFASDPRVNKGAVGPGRANSMAANLRWDVLGWPESDP